MNISWEEIPDGQVFEDLVAAYFKDYKNGGANIVVRHSGIGTDGGRDLLVEMEFHDNIIRYKRKWVVQCKFHTANISPSKIADVNIPTLIHSYKASGYLLICRQHPTSALTNLFENLTKDCKFGYGYEIWTGSHFINEILNKPPIIQQFFPKYYHYAKQNGIFQ